MGCLAIFLYPAAIWVFSKVGWITLAGEASVWKAGFWALGCIILVDLLTWGLQALVQLFSIPLSCLTGGVFFRAIQGIFKYFGLALAAHWSHLFVVPWIFGDYWWHAILIGFSFAVIGSLIGVQTKSNFRYSRKYTFRSR